MEEVFIVLLGILLRWCVSLYPYSGSGSPPMYGDYEAQRHWQELTINLSVEKWYRNGTNNDLLYWGIDYPPLSSYHSFLCGTIAYIINPEYVTLYESRGYESKEHKLFMRYSVLFSDIVILFCSVLLWRSTFVKFNHKKSCTKHVLAALLLYPGLYLIDYGHFQYNNVSLGLFLISIACFLQNRDYIGSIFFCFSLNYKQMELYHALPIFVYLCGLCFKQNSYYNVFTKFLKLGLTVILSFIVCWAPFLTSIKSIKDLFARIFPLNRGLYEDKVANFWCSVNIILKIKSLLTNSELAVFCFLATIFFSLPSCIHLLFNPTKLNLKYSLFNVSLAFFMFSFHVHEKSILLVAVPAAFLFDKHRLSVIWFLQITTLSMFPLLVKDGLTIPTLSLTLLSYFLYYFKYGNRIDRQLDILMDKIYKTSVMMLFLLCILSLVIPPPNRYPDLYPVLISVYCFFNYFNFFIFFNYCQYGHVQIININKFLKIS